jgi:hypothetical protein
MALSVFPTSRRVVLHREEMPLRGERMASTELLALGHEREEAADKTARGRGRELLSAATPPHIPSFPGLVEMHPQWQ